MLACCGLKMLILAAVSVGSAAAIARNAAIGAGGLALAVALTAYCIRRRRWGDDSGATGKP